MTAPEDRRDEGRFEQTLSEEERAAGAYSPDSEAASDAPETQADAASAEEEGVPDFEPDEDLAAGPPDGR